MDFLNPKENNLGRYNFVVSEEYVFDLDRGYKTISENLEEL